MKIIPVNKPGASTVLASEAVVRAKKDGYTLLYGGTSATVYVPVANPEIIKYDPARDLEPLGYHYLFPQAIGVKGDAPWKTFGEFIDYAKKYPGKIRVSTIGVNSQPHFVLEMISVVTGARFTHVPFEGGESVVTAVMGGHVEAACDGFAKMRPYLDAGRMKVLLTTNKLPDYPTIPTTTELGYKQKLYPSQFIVYAPAGIPEEARKVLVPAIEKAVKATKPKVDLMGSLGEYHAPAEIVRMREEEYREIYDLAVRMGIRK